jgi:hypothetical protein
MRLKKHAKVRHIVFAIGHFPSFSLPLVLDEKEEAMQKDGEKMEELEQTVFELRR